MPHRHPKPPPTIPTLWLMTDERMGERLWSAIAALPRGAGIVFRHYATPPRDRRALFARVAALARRRHLILVRAGPKRLGRHEAGVHGAVTDRGLRTWAAHSRTEAVAGKRGGAAALFVSPIFPTRSHPGARASGPLRAAGIARGLGLPVIALGGLDARRFRRLRGLGFHGWAAIDAWLPDQKRNAVPI